MAYVHHDYDVIESPDRDELVRWLASWCDKGWGLVGTIQVAERGEGQHIFVATIVKPPIEPVIGPIGPKGDKGEKGDKGDQGIQGPAGRAVVWRYNIGALPLAQRQVTSGGSQVDVIPSVSLTVDTTHRYCYSLSGVVLIETASSGGDIWIAHGGVDVANMWQDRSGTAPAGTNYATTVNNVSRSVQPTVATQTVRLRMRRTSGSGALTLDPSFGEIWLELWDMGVA